MTEHTMSRNASILEREAAEMDMFLALTQTRISTSAKVCKSLQRTANPS